MPEISVSGTLNERRQQQTSDFGSNRIKSERTDINRDI